jgi:dihydrofolate reductase
VTVTLIWAEAANRVIGSNGTIPWRLPEEQQHFKRLTMGGTVVMGRGTWESLPASVRPLPGRRNIVVTRQASYDAPGADVVSSVEEALKLADAEDVWIAGGAGIYEDALPLADRVVRTRVHVQVDGDTYAPVLDSAWTMVARDPESGLHKSETGLEYCVATLERR